MKRWKMTEEEKEKLIKKWQTLLDSEVVSDATCLLIEPMEIPLNDKVKEDT
jgi:hypothetical protein